MRSHFQLVWFCSDSHFNLELGIRSVLTVYELHGAEISFLSIYTAECRLDSYVESVQQTIIYYTDSLITRNFYPIREETDNFKIVTFLSQRDIQMGAVFTLKSLPIERQVPAVLSFSFGCLRQLSILRIDVLLSLFMVLAVESYT